MLQNTSISITQKTRKALAIIGVKGQTYDEIVQKLLEKWNDEN